MHREEALPGISHAHYPQTLIPHMPIPPQESAPSLSPRQSFGCQSPLPWVAGTDRTRILWALRQLQGFLPGVLFFPCALPHLEGSLTGQQASCSPVLRNHNIPRENTDTSTQFSTGFSFRERTRVSSETRAFSDKTQLTVSEMNQGIQQRSYRFHA